MNAILYARFSPRKNAEDCESVETQLERARQYCGAAGMEIIGEYSDKGLSGARADNRPGLADALDHVCREKACLVVYSLSRLARNTRDAIEIAERLNRAGADLASLHEKIDTTSAMGRFVFKLMSALAELEREQISERTSDAMLRHQANGRRMSDRTPYGWIRNPRNPALLIIDEDEQALIQHIMAEHRHGVSLRQIARDLMAAGISFRGGPWHHTTLRRIIAREKGQKVA